MYLYELPKSADATELPLGLSGSLGQSGSLRHFSGSELILSGPETAAVFRFFWPDIDVARLGGITDADRGFAQALLVEAVDASCTMGIAESLYRRFFLKVPTSFTSILKSAAAVALQAIQNRWFKRCTNVTSADVKIYESVRKTLALNFRSVMQLRLQTGELTY